MTIDVSQFYQVFFEEATEHLASLETLLLGFDVDSPDPDRLDEIFRAAHSIKGGAGTFGFHDMAEVTHVLESALDRVRHNELRLSLVLIDAFLAAGDVVRGQLDAHRQGAAVDPQNAELARAQLAAAVEAAAQIESLADTPSDQPAKPIASTGSETADAGYGFFDTSEPDGDPGFGFFDEVTKVEDPGYGFFDSVPTVSAEEASAARPPVQTEAVQHGPAAIKLPRKEAERPQPTNSAEASSIRVGVDKVDQLINLVGELVITQAMLAQTAGALDPVLHEALVAGVAQLARNTRDLQEAVMSIRMLPMSMVYSRFPRVVRDLAKKLGKKVELRTFGEATELDKGLIEKIADPLTHLVRNSLDHGLESPEKRAASGKDGTGTITLRAFHQGGNVVIEVSDDGAGLNREKILARAREKGIAVSDSMSDDDVWQLIFAPGFSTAEVITDVSGRGVGMDVVRKNIHDLGGHVEISSEQGWGTTTRIRLPLTLAILDGMSVAVEGDIFILPLASVIESLRPEDVALKTIAGDGRVVRVHGEYLPVVELVDRFGLVTHRVDPRRGILVVIEADGRKAALLVDELVSQQQVVIKSIETNYRKVAGVSGATIMGDGRVALILDVGALVRTSGPQLAEAA